MGDRWTAAGGWAVEIVTLSGTPNHRDGAWIRLTHHGIWVTDVRTPGELAEFVNLAELREALSVAA